MMRYLRWNVNPSQFDDWLNSRIGLTLTEASDYNLDSEEIVTRIVDVKIINSSDRWISFDIIFEVTNK